MNAPLVTILINNYNYARFLVQCIESALEQTYSNTEVVVVDDCSSDHSRQVLEGYAGRVVTVLQERNGGQAAAINAGFRSSRGDIVMMLDSDDYLYPQAAENVAKAYVTGCSKVQYRLDFIGTTGVVTGTYPARVVRFDSGDVLPLLLKMGRYETTVTSGNAFSRSVLAEIMPIPEEEFRISADGYLVSLAPFYGPVVSIEEPLGAYRQHGSNAWWSGSEINALAARLRRSLEHDERKYCAIRSRARALGLVCSREPGLRDPQHLEVRIASLQTEPSLHPYRGDTRGELGWRGFVASARANTSWRRRCILASWFLMVGLFPGSLASSAVGWKLTQKTRPKKIDRILRALSRLTR